MAQNDTKVDNTTKPYLLRISPDWRPDQQVNLAAVNNPISNRTLGDIGIATEVNGISEFPLAILIQPYDSTKIVGIDDSSIRVFRWDSKIGSVEPVWSSGINTSFGFIWAKIQMQGTYIPIGLPRDRLLQETLRKLALDRRYMDRRSQQEMHALTQNALKFLVQSPSEVIDGLRASLTRIEVNTNLKRSSPEDVVLGHGLHILTFQFPQRKSTEEFKEIIRKIETPQAGLPEEALFYPPEILRNGQPPWPTHPDQQPWNGIDWSALQSLPMGRDTDIVTSLPWLFSHNWYMYQHDDGHSGHASGLSDITSTNVNTLVLHSEVPVDGPVNTKPSIVDDKIYVGTTRYHSGPGGTLYKIDISTGNIDGKFPTSGTAFYSISGIGGSPAIINGKVYFSTVHGKVYCVNATTMTSSPPYPDPLWVTDLKHSEPIHNQPVNNPNADSWTSPIVVNGKVYVGCGEGEARDTYGFIYCLDANNGNVIWLFCASKFINRRSSGSENNPNVIPSSVAISDPLPSWAISAGFSIQPDPIDPATNQRQTGCSVWSSCAFDRILNRIYVGTGNSFSDSGIPDDWYGSGLLSLDADTGAFKAFFQPSIDDSYWPRDSDLDVPCSPTIISRGENRVVAVGNKDGAFFLLDPDRLNPLARRQLLPRSGGIGLPEDRGSPIQSVVNISLPTDPHPRFENRWGIFGTAAVDSLLGRIFVGLGGYDGIGDFDKTPFMRALDWNTLRDAWPTAIGADNVSRYTTSRPPMYTSNESGLSSPAVVNDIVFVSTHKTALYAFDANTGLCLWSAPGMPSGGSPNYALGPAIYGNYVVIGAKNSVYIYKLT